MQNKKMFSRRYFIFIYMFIVLSIVIVVLIKSSMASDSKYTDNEMNYNIINEDKLFQWYFDGDNYDSVDMYSSDWELDDRGNNQDVNINYSLKISDKRHCTIAVIDTGIDFSHKD